LDLRDFEVTVGCRKLHNEELHVLCPSPDVMGGTQ